MLLLTDNDIRSAFSGVDAIGEAIDAVERSFAAAYRGEASSGSLLLTHPAGSSFHQEAQFALSATWGIWPGAGVAGGRMMALRRQDQGESSVRADGLRYWRAVWSTATGELLGLIVDGYAEQLLVGAHVGVATRHLARPESSSVGVIGSGGLAGPCLHAVCASRPITRAKVYSPTRRHRIRFAAEWRERLGIDVEPADSAAAACRDVDIVTAATSAHARVPRQPAVIRQEWISPGTHINSIASFEVDESLHACSKVIPSSISHLRDQGIPMEPTTSLLREDAVPAANLPADLIEVVGRGLRVRERDDDITLYIGPSLGFQHAAVNELVIERARRCRVGIDWDPQLGTVAARGSVP